ncbi:conserved hypothetical protein [Tenacibaculum litopenaei]|uniref:hypothetical protein n=1 Tax=Tenacibaculum litopenaei TaxID=396016 RepID=UPI003895D812
MKSFIVVPIHTNLLHLKDPMRVIKPHYDFSKLPYFNGSYNVNENTPYLGDAISAKPFQNRDHLLKPGVHLHWALPDALTQGTHTEAQTTFPIIPNRWLVAKTTRVYRKDVLIDTKSNKWIVESDYLYPHATPEPELATTTTYPVMWPTPSDAHQPPYHHMGRKVRFEHWKEQASERYLMSKPNYELSAIGYGSPDFASNYVNCHSVLGFHDEEPAQAGEVITYEIIGWYSDEAKDVLKQYVDNLTAKNSAITPSEIVENISNHFNWVTEEKGGKSPSQTLCYSSVEYTAPQKGQTLPEHPALKNRVGNQVSVGNSLSETMSSLIADNLAKDDKALKTRIEEELETISLLDDLEHHDLDLQYHMQDQRHLSGFKTSGAGELWLVKLETKDTANTADSKSGTHHHATEIPADVSLAVNNLNTLQIELNKRLNVLETQQQELFSYWYKYLEIRYNTEAFNELVDIDEMKELIENKYLQDVENEKLNIGHLRTELNKLKQQLEQRITAFNQDAKNIEKKITLVLRSEPAPRYYQPNDVNILLSGPLAEASIRHGFDGRLRADNKLRCHTVNAQNLQELLANTKPLVKAVYSSKESKSIAVNRVTTLPWNPQTIEWEVNIFPQLNADTAHSKAIDYTENTVEANYRVAADAPDFHTREGSGISSVSNTLQGRNFIGQHPKEILKNKLKNYLLNHIDFNAYFKANNLPVSDKKSYFETHGDKVITWYLSLPVTGKPDYDSNVSETARRNYENQVTNRNYAKSYALLINETFHINAMSLGGFNEGMLMQETAMQLPIHDPVGFVNDQAFVNRVKSAIGNTHKYTPLPLNNYLPIRAGHLEIAHLDLIDSFGRTVAFKSPEIVRPVSLESNFSQNFVQLYPRLSHPARLWFRWISASDLAVESNQTANSSPVFGWVVANNLDFSLEFYTASGEQFGIINADVLWEAFPGKAEINLREAGKNADNQQVLLLDFINRILTFSKAEFQAFITNIDESLEHIHPADFSMHFERALIQGRPMALTKAQVAIEVKGAIPENQSWEAYRDQLNAANDQVHPHEHVNFPIRIGEHHRLDDGTIGYWLDDNDQYDRNTANLPYITNPDDSTSFSLNMKNGQQNLTLLIDPRAKIHATSGILPVKNIALLPVHFKNALSKIQVSSRVMPILSSKSHLEFPLPSDPELTLNWIENQGDQWRTISQAGNFSSAQFTEVFGAVSTELWAELKSKTWIQETRPGAAKISSKDDRSTVALIPKFIPLTAKIESFFNSVSIHNPITETQFQPDLILREGWISIQNK